MNETPVVFIYSFNFIWRISKFIYIFAFPLKTGVLVGWVSG